MKSNLRMLAIMLLLFLANTAGSQNSLNTIQEVKRSWSASWITNPGIAQREYTIIHFRKSFAISELPRKFTIHITADNRYRLFVNCKPVSSGPARGALFNWYYETINIAKYLKPGKNIITAQVWNMGTLGPVAQISNQTAFLIQGNSPTEEIVNTDTTWKVTRNIAYTPCSVDNGERLQAYMVVGPGDKVDGSKYPWGWQNLTYDDSQWDNAITIAHPESVGHGTDNRWTLAPRNIPLFKEKQVRFPLIRRTVGLSIKQENITGHNPITIPANMTASILVDASVNTVAYPELLVSQGKGSSIKLTYAESLFGDKGNKGNRNEIDHKTIKGNYDIFLPDGGMLRKFRPLWIRAYRYLQLDITTGKEPLIINDLYSMTIGYPLEMKASFSCNDASLKNIWDVGWRTARLCAGDLYYDTPYYEQLQYTGDSRIQALISLYMSGDDRLMRKAILDFYHSRTPEGLTQGRYPSNRLQIIPPFSLFWVSMIHDYWMHRQDDQFIKQFLPAINEIMTWYENKIDTNKNMLGPLTWWNFIDWDNFDGWGAAPGSADGNSSIISLQYAYTLNQAADLFMAFNKVYQADEYRKLAKSLAKETYKRCYNNKKGLIADTPEQLTYSQHAGIWAILSEAIPQNDRQSFMTRILEDKSIGQVTFFYRFYLTRALNTAKMGDLYYSNLTPWRDMLKLGLTTFAEKPEPTRSDCHAWSASPNYDFLATICGITPAAAGFKKVNIEPALGELQSVDATMPCPDGEISVKFERQNTLGVKAIITLPQNLTGNFIWNGKKYALSPGKQHFSI